MATPEPDKAGHVEHEVGREIVVKVEGLQKYFGRNHVLRGIDLEVHKGEVVVLIGPSGSGKSTFLRCLNFLEDPTEGDITIGGVHARCGSHGGGFKKAVHEIRMKCGMVFQEFNLFPHKDATENVTEGPDHGEGREEGLRRSRRPTTLLTKVGLADRMDFFPSQLSGGQKQRVAIARAMAMDPVLMLFDEPTSALDPELIGEVLKVMKDLAATGMTMIVVSHEMGFSRDVADRVVYMDEGMFIEQGPPSEVFFNPKDERTIRFLRHILPEKEPEHAKELGIIPDDEGAGRRGDRDRGHVAADDADGAERERRAAARPRAARAADAARGELSRIGGDGQTHRGGAGAAGARPARPVTRGHRA